MRHGSIGITPDRFGQRRPGNEHEAAARVDVDPARARTAARPARAMTDWYTRSPEVPEPRMATR
jgi:hypothetical protein